MLTLICINCCSRAILMRSLSFSDSQSLSLSLSPPFSRSLSPAGFFLRSPTLCIFHLRALCFFWSSALFPFRSQLLLLLLLLWPLCWCGGSFVLFVCPSLIVEPVRVCVFRDGTSTGILVGGGGMLNQY